MATQVNPNTMNNSVKGSREIKKYKDGIFTYIRKWPKILKEGEVSIEGHIQR